MLYNVSLLIDIVSLQPPEHIEYAALVIAGSFLIEGRASLVYLPFPLFSCDWRESFSGASLIVAIHAVRKGAAAEGMKVRDYVWRGHDPTAVAVMTEVHF